MALVLKDRVQESATANTTVSFTLSGAIAGYQAFTAIGNGNTVYYGASDGVNWEVGTGTYTLSTTTLARTTILSSSNSGSAVTFSGTVTVFCDYPAEQAVYQSGPFQGTIDNTVIGGTTPAAGTFTTITGQTEVLKGTGANLVTQSQTFSSWTKTGLTLTNNSTTAPDATNTGSLIVEDTSTGNHQVFFNNTVLTASTYTYSIYAKANTRNWLKVSLDNGTLKGVYFDVTNGVVGTADSGYTGTILSVGNGWYRCSIVITFTASASYYPDVNIASANGTISYTGNGTSGLYIWGSQVEFGSTANTYIPTTTTAVYGTPTLSFSGVAGLGLQSDGSLYVSPAGTGALQAQATTSTATGGNARGANAVDWQTYVRGAASQVASGLASVVGGGARNTSNGIATTVAGGQDNTANGTSSAVLGGASNTASTAVSAVVGGQANSASGIFNFIGGGFTNSATSASAVTTQTTTIATTAGTTLYLSSANANIRVGAYVTGTGIATYSYATSTVTTGTAAVMATSSISGTTLTVGSVSSGTIIAGQVLTGTGVTAGTYIVSGSGLSWVVSASQTVASTTITGTAYTFTISQNATTTAGITLSFYTPHGVVVGGGNNQATGAYSFIGGGGDAGTAANRNVASGTWSTVGGGVQNQATGDGSVIGGGGYLSGSAISGNLASGTGAYIGAGYSCTASGTQSAIFNGYSSFANGAFSFCGNGSYGTTRSLTGNHTFPASQNPLGSTAGACQSSLLNLGIITTTATPAVLTSNQNAAGTTNQVIMPNNSAYYFKGSVIANVTGAANGAAWDFSGAIMRGANAASTVLIGTPMLNRVAASAGATAWSIAITADTANGGLAVTVTGVAATTIRWVAKIETTEVTY